MRAGTPLSRAVPHGRRQTKDDRSLRCRGVPVSYLVPLGVSVYESTQCDLSLLAVATLAVFCWANRPSAEASDARKAKASLNCGCCCEDPACPPGCDERCPPGCDSSCPSDCALCPSSAVAKPVIAKAKCEGNKCCPATCNVALTGKTQ
jgi:hypothetical protein